MVVCVYILFVCILVCVSVCVRLCMFCVLLLPMFGEINEYYSSTRRRSDLLCSVGLLHNPSLFTADD